MLQSAIGSVLSQTISDFECIVVDDASPAPPILPKDSRVKLVIRQSNGGPAAARNTGLAHAAGRYIAFLDDDDLYSPERLNLALEGLRAAPISICWSRYLDNGSTWNHVLRGKVHHIIADTTTPHLGATAIRSEYVLPFDERYVAVQDVEWWLRVSRSAAVWTTETVGYLVRRHPGHRHRNNGAARVRCSLLLLKMHADYFNNHPRAAAFRWKRIALMAGGLGDYALARKALMRSLILQPDGRTLLHFARALKLSSTKDLALDGEGLA
jgi:glycosyltransferase involved in cell wall biosynthesis